MVSNVLLRTEKSAVDISLRSYQRWLTCAVLSSWIAIIIFDALRDAASSNRLAVYMFGSIAVGACILWASFVKEVVTLCDSHIRLQSWFGHLRLGDEKLIDKDAIVDVELRVRRTRAKGGELTSRRLVLITSEGEVYLRTQLSLPDGELLCDIVKSSLTGKPDDGVG
ncbi:hypothetical protein [Dyella sp. C11]|uniref:hypothetical protein n=1 Tax=Dyella sp. C11 TaxID=2126991 RepID=UPI000D65ACA8|nr:hypothetical protein [Dyella sp. C11]